MSVVYNFEGKVIKFSGNRYVLYPSKKYQEKLKQFHGRKVKIIVIVEPEYIKQP